MTFVATAHSETHVQNIIIYEHVLSQIRAVLKNSILFVYDGAVEKGPLVVWHMFLYVSEGESFFIKNSNLNSFEYLKFEEKTEDFVLSIDCRVRR